MAPRKRQRLHFIFQPHMPSGIGISYQVRKGARTYVNEAGGWIALHNEYMETTMSGIYVAGDLANIEEASTAMIEGKIAGLHAAHSLSTIPHFKSRYEELQMQLGVFREGHFGVKPFQAKKKIHEEYYETMGQ